MNIWDFLKWSIEHGEQGTFLIALSIVSAVGSIGVAMFRALGSFGRHRAKD